MNIVEHDDQCWTDGLRQLAEIIRESRKADWLAVSHVLDDCAANIDRLHAKLVAKEAENAELRAEAETARYMREIAQGLGYPTTLEALEDVSELREKVKSLPDYIELFRIIRAAGRNDREKARAVFVAITPTLEETQPERNPDND